ncbi:MAG TPA: indolepyruvate ferredoxin oxidoreductase subunit alpha [Methanomicrobia archaeon]|nr:indolepyruvate ferredoxin oxidoreductase subunit alpha [Methanomicrobia archaeon]
MKSLMMGNEAIGRGAIEGGVSIVSAYPGTPSSEIPAYIADHAHEHNVFVEYSTNEKVALEVAIGASWSGLRALVTMKHVGVNVAADALMSLTYTGTDGGLVLVSADDPSCHSSQNEQDNRYYARLANIPTLEPSSPQEALVMTREAFALSEDVGLPVMLRPTTRSCHCRADVETGEKLPQNEGPAFEHDITHKVTIPAHARLLHPELLEKVERARELFEKSPFNWIEGHGTVGVIGSGISYAYVKEAVSLLGADVEVLKLGTVHPLPKDLITTFITSKEKIIIVEEMEPVVEEQVKAFAYDLGLDVDIHGKDVIPRMGELTTTRVKAGLAQVLSIQHEEHPVSDDVVLPPRPPTLCPGCPHRATFYCINKVAKKSIKTSDIGCYTLGVVAPLSAVDTTLCMGASIGVACGLAAAGNKGVFATIGDSTFFHTGIPPLIDAVYNGHDINVVVLDNRTTAMTGHQPHPGTGWTATRREAPKIDIAELCISLGAYTQVVDPQDLDDTVEAMKRARDHEGVSVIVAMRPCALLVGPIERDAEHFEVDTETCNGCKACIKQLGCPALLFDEESKKAEIDTLLCTGCGVCAQVCPFNAITSM